MKRFEQFLESKNYQDSNKVNAIEDMADALREVFKKYSLPTRRFALEKLLSKKGQAELKKLVQTPRRSLNTIRKLWSEAVDFDAWLDEKSSR